jgi:hypothetical protein
MSSIAPADAVEMATDFDALAKSLGDTASALARRWAAQRVFSVHRYGQILAEYGAGRSTGRATAGAFARLAAEEAKRYPTEAFQLWSDYLTAIARTAGLSLDQVGDSGRHGSERRSAERESRSVLDLDMTGVLGNVVSRDFTLDNPHDIDVSIRFVAGHFVGRDHEVQANPVFDPPEFLLLAGAEQKVTVSVKLDSRQFHPQQTYNAMVAVSGFDDMILRVHVTVADAE